jgi:hypothetical protein
MRSDKARIWHLGEDWVSCPSKLKKNIEEADPNGKWSLISKGEEDLEFEYGRIKARVN